MMLPIPGVGTEAGPNYALDINSCLTLIDAHDHSPGNGVPIGPSGMFINAALSMHNNPLQALSYASFTALNSPSSVLQSLYVAPGTETPVLQDLWFTDSAGNQIQLTSNGLVNATIGSLPGESYSAGTFFWKQGTGSTTPANFDIGSIVLRPNVAATTFGVTLTPPGSISSAWTMTLPSDPSAQGGTNYLLLDTAGNVTSGALVDNSSIEFASHLLRVKAGGITSAMLATGIRLPTYQDFSANGTFVVPTGVGIVTILGVGGGGGGGSSQTQGSGGGGGGGCSPVESIITVTPGDSLVIAIGSGGAGATAGTNTPGANGNNTVITRTGTPIFVAPGGGGGLANRTGGSATSTGYFSIYSTFGGTGGIANSVGGTGSPSLIALTQSTGGPVGPNSGSAGGGGGGNGFGVGGTGGQGAGGQVSQPSQVGTVGGQGAGGGGGGAPNGLTGNTVGSAGSAGGNGFVRIFYTSP